mgnify:CR=1 FL=1
MVRGVFYDREDTCPDCKRQRALEIYDRNHKPGYMSMILDRNQLDRFKSRQFYYLKCSVCGKEYEMELKRYNQKLYRLHQLLTFQQLLNLYQIDL